MTTALQARAHRVAADLGLAKIPVKKVELLYSENGTFWLADYESFADADDALRMMAVSAPADGTYHKTGYKVTFMDGESYEGRVCLKRHDSDFPTVIQWAMRSFVDYHAGRACPDRMNAEEYERCLAFYDSSENSNRKGFGEFRDKYDF